MPNLILVAPLAGWCSALEEVPDEVFSTRMLGDGLAIDPLGATLHAPCDGSVVSIAPQRHAITLRATNGAEILLHVGIDTVELGGEGFEALVAAGENVTAGRPLLSFDLDRLARRAKSLMTAIIVTDGARFSIERRSPEREIGVGDFLFELAVIAEASPTAIAGADEEATRQLVVPLEHGIHARPAAILASRLKGFVASVTVQARGRTANARSPVAMMSLGIRKGERVSIRARGNDAAAAVAAFEAAMLGIVEAAHASPPIEVVSPVSQNPKALRGVIACRGFAVGRAVHLTRPEIHVAEAGVGVSVEDADLERARGQVKARLQALARSGRGAQQEIIAAHLEFLEDPELLAGARAWLTQGKSAGYAWRAAVRSNIEALRALDDTRLAERADDLLDLESQVLIALAGETVKPAASALPERAIVLARELLPSQLIALDTSRVAGIAISTGGPTSHVAILAAAIDIPTLVAMGPAILDIADDTALVIDANEGVLHVDPDTAQRQTAQTQADLQRQQRVAQRAAARREGRTSDGVRIQIFANVGSVAEARIAADHGAEGCGLLRTEFLFLDRQTAPTPDEQVNHYQQIADVFAGQPLVIRTLDIGGDKPVPYLPLPGEENPALGLRGIRVSLWRPELLREQLRAVLRIEGPAHCRILLPMITEVSEILTVRAMVASACRELGRAAAIPIGAMIETPAAALNAGQIARAADFLSIGTNDLAQYTLAIDRGHPQLAVRLNALHPAVLRLIALAVEGARAHDRPIAVCGGLASDPAAAPILIGLGIHELSAVPAAIPQLKSLIGALSMQECRALAAEALEG